MPHETDTPFTLAFFGGPGAGKNTQAEMLRDLITENDPHRPLHYIEVGKILRNYTDTHDDLTARGITERIDHGKLVPPFIPITFWASKLMNDVNANDHVLIDGAGRTIPEAQALADAMHFYGRDMHVLVLEVSEDTALERTAGRTDGRIDDADKEKVRRRMEWFEDTVKPAIQTLEKEGFTVHRIDGEADIDTVHRNVKATLNLSF